jgi:TrmH family RNA methyltransferase
MISKNHLKQIRLLHSKRNRDEQHLFIAEGVKVVKEILESHPGIIKELFGSPDFVNTNKALISKTKIMCHEVSENELKQLSALTTPNDAFAVCKYLENTHPVMNFDKEIVLYLDEIRDPGNFGTIIRLADWFGVKTIFCSTGCCDLYNPKVIQSTMGAFLRVDIVYASLEEVISNNKIQVVYGAVLKGNDIYKEKLSYGIIVIGNEANGISGQNLARINKPLTIPSHPQSGSESLNAAMATSIIVSEFFRQLR